MRWLPYVFIEFQPFDDNLLELGTPLAYLSWLCYISDSECYSESQLYLYG